MFIKNSTDFYLKQNLGSYFSWRNNFTIFHRLLAYFSHNFRISTLKKFDTRKSWPEAELFKVFDYKIKTRILETKKKNQNERILLCQLVKFLGECFIPSSRWNRIVLNSSFARVIATKWLGPRNDRTELLMIERTNEKAGRRNERMNELDTDAFFPWGSSCGLHAREYVDKFKLCPDNYFNEHLMTLHVKIGLRYLRSLISLKITFDCFF